jgi:NAD(P)-dependent dehydrogenase (short-subunit alcohol dehydrogenase family)
MSGTSKTVIVTGGSQGIGSGIVRAFLDRDYNVVASSRAVTKSKHLPSSPNLALVDGDIGEATTAARVADTAVTTFGSIDALVNNAGIFFMKPFTDYSVEDFNRLVSVNLAGFVHMTQRAIDRMLSQGTGGSIVSITASLADNPVAGANASIPMMTKAAIGAITRSLAIEYAKDGIRLNAVAPGAVDTPLNNNNPKDFLQTLSPMGSIAPVQEIVNAVIYLTEASYVTGEVLHVDGGAHTGKW